MDSTNELMCKKPNSKLPEHTSELELAEKFNSFFVSKIEKIRRDLNDTYHNKNADPDPTSMCY